MKKLLSTIVLFLFFTLTLTNSLLADSPAADSNEVKNYVQSLLNNTFNILNDTNMPIENKKQKIRILLGDNLDTQSMSNRSLGRLKNNYQPEELNKFTSTYKEYLINNYANSVENYKGQDVKIKAINKVKENYYTVETEIISDGDQIFNVNYLVKKESSIFKVLDISTEGISLVSTQQREFSQILNNNNLAFLIDRLKTKSSQSDTNE
jgi:phospholipid transport system substrate-binding protein